MKKILLIGIFIITLIIIFPLAGAIIEEDWGNYTRADKTKRDGSGNNITLNWLRKSYTNENGKYTIMVRGFDPDGTVALDVNFRGRYEMVLLRAEWDPNNKTNIIPEPVEAFNKTMIITLNKLTPSSGAFTCCPEAEIGIDLIMPELYLEFNNDDTHSYRMFKEIPIEINVTNYGDAESTSTEVFIDTDGLDFEYGYPYYQLPTLAGEEQKNYNGATNHTINMKFKFPVPPKKLNYTVHAYVKGVKGDTIYYYDDTKEISLIPSVSLQKYVTEESMLLNRRNVEDLYRGIDSDSIPHWLQGGEIYVTLGVTNYQNYEIQGMILNDTLPDQFTVENNSLNWTFDLKPRETKEFKYKLKAQRPGRFTLPSARLTYYELNRVWNNQSNTPSTEIHGPCIQVYKKVDKPVLNRGENATITLNIRNSGDMPSRVKITDPLAENTTFLDGHMYYEGVIPPKDSVALSYNISVNEYGQIQLPAPVIYVNGMKDPGCSEPIISKIAVKEPPKPTSVSTPVSTPSPKKTTNTSLGTPIATPTPNIQQYRWIEGLFPALMLVFAVTVLLVLHRSTK